MHKDIGPDANVLAPGIVTFRPDADIQSAQDWQRYLGDLNITAPTGERYQSSGDGTEKTRNPTRSHPRWAADLSWHIDGYHRGASKVVTGIYYHLSTAKTAGTEILDTTKLLDTMRLNAVFAQAGVDDDTLEVLEAEFTMQTFFNEVLPKFGQSQQTHRIEAYTNQITRRYGSIRSYVEAMDKRTTPSRIPLLKPNPFDPTGACGLMFDAGPTCSDIVDPRTRQSYRHLLDVMREYVRQSEGDLRDRGALHVIAPKKGTAVLFSREGTLHRAQPGDAFRRIINATLISQ